MAENIEISICRRLCRAWPPRPFINNEFVSSSDSSLPLYPIISPTNEHLIIDVPSTPPSLVERAVTSARHAYDQSDWATQSPSKRAEYLTRIADALTCARDRLAHIECVNTGKPYAECECDISDAAMAFTYFASRCADLTVKQRREVVLPDDRFTGAVVYEPVGVVAAIVPFNYPLLMAVWKLAPALAAGCTVVLKPSQYTPLTALELGLIIAEAGVPAGVLSIVLGGAETGQALVDADIDKVTFTGSSETGARITARIAPSFKRISSECGGKSAAIVMSIQQTPNALKTLIEWIILGFCFTNGQICSATSRLILHADIADTVMNALVAAVKTVAVVNPIDSATGEPASDQTGQIGPIISRQQYDRVLEYLKSAKSDANCEILCGGAPAEQYKRGYYIQPTVIKASTTSRVWNEEIFGPVLSVAVVNDEESAIALANSTRYGLAAAVFSVDSEQEERFVRRLRTGIVWVACSQPTFCQLPWGGRKHSGIGRDLGEDGMYTYLETKQVVSYSRSAGAYGWYKI